MQGNTALSNRMVKSRMITVVGPPTTGLGTRTAGNSLLYFHQSVCSCDSQLPDRMSMQTTLSQQPLMSLTSPHDLNLPHVFASMAICESYTYKHTFRTCVCSRSQRSVCGRRPILLVQPKRLLETDQKEVIAVTTSLQLTCLNCMQATLIGFYLGSTDMLPPPAFFGDVLDKQPIHSQKRGWPGGSSSSRDSKDDSGWKPE